MKRYPVMWKKKCIELLRKEWHDWEGSYRKVSNYTNVTRAKKVLENTYLN